MTIIMLVIGFVAGAWFGVITTAVLAAGSRGEWDDNERNH